MKTLLQAAVPVAAATAKAVAKDANNVKFVEMVCTPSLLVLIKLWGKIAKFVIFP